MFKHLHASPNSGIVNELKRRAEHRGVNAHDKQKRTGLLVCGGTMKGVFGAGVMIGLELLGHSDSFDVVCGVSAGSANAMYLLARQTILGTSIYYEDLISREFINPLRLHRIADMDFVMSKFRDGPKAINVERVSNGATPFFAVATTQNGRGVFLNAKVATLDMVHASIAIPGLYNRPVLIGEERHFDGVASNPLPIGQMVRRFNLTNLLVVINEPIRLINERINPLESLLTALTVSKYPMVREGFLRRHMTQNLSMKGVHLHDCEVRFISPDHEISKHCNNPDELRRMVVHGVHKTWRLLSGLAPPPDNTFLL